MAITTAQRESLIARHGTHFELYRFGFVRNGNCRKAQWSALDAWGGRIVAPGYTLPELKRHLRERFGKHATFDTKVLW